MCLENEPTAPAEQAHTYHTFSYNVIRVMNKPTVPLPTDEAGHTPHCGSEMPAAQRQETFGESGEPTAPAEQVHTTRRQ